MSRAKRWPWGLLPLPGAEETAFHTGFTALFGQLVAPAVVQSRGISCYGMLLFTGLVSLGILLCRRNRECTALAAAPDPNADKPARAS